MTSDVPELPITPGNLFQPTNTTVEGVLPRYMCAGSPVFRSHFWPLQIDTQLNFCLEIFDKMATVGHFGCPKFTLDRISGHFRSIGHFGFPKFTFDRNSGHFRSIRIGCPKITFDHSSCHFRSIRNFFLIFLDKMAAPAILDWTTMSVIELARDIWMNNACVKFEERSLNPSKLIALTTKLYAAADAVAADAVAALLTKT